MCGIITAFSKKGRKINKSLLKRYEAQKGRGQQGFGYVAFYGNRYSVGRSTDESGIRKKIGGENACIMMFHHRLPTSTPNVEEATHPIYVSHDELDYDYYISHNGVISNAGELRKLHEALKYVYRTVVDVEEAKVYTAKHSGNKYHISSSKVEKFNDSEALAIEIARCVDGMTSKINAVGSIAFTGFKINKTTQALEAIIWGHNSRNPMTLTDNNDVFILASEGGTPVEEDVLFTLPVETGEIIERKLCIGYTSDYNKNNDTNITRTLPAPSNNTHSRFTEPYKEYERRRVGDDVRSINNEKMDDFLDRHYSGRVVNNFGDMVDPKYKYDPAFDDAFGETNEPMGFGTGGNMDTTDKEYLKGDWSKFKEYATQYVDEWRGKNAVLIKYEDDLAVCNAMIAEDGTDQRDILMLTKEANEIEEKIQRLQEEMNEIEDAYIDDLGEDISFMSVIEAIQDDEEIADRAIQSDREAYEEYMRNKD